MKAIANKIQASIQRIRRWMAGPKKAEEISIQTYLSYGDRNALHVFGRVIAGYSDPAYQPSRSRFLYFYKVIRLFLAVKVPQVNITLRAGKQAFHLKTNSEGFFSENVTLNQDIQALVEQEEGELPRVELFYHLGGQEKVMAHSEAILLDKRTKKIFISDIDDTVLKSRATRFISMAIKTLLYPPRKRQMFPETSRAYKKLQKGIDGRQLNLFFYVSSSTWDIYPLLKEFLEINELPEGPLILQDIQGEKQKQHTNPHAHKRDRIQEIINVYPQCPVVLIGDAGQSDQDIYLDLAERHPQKIEKILIRRTWWQKTAGDSEEHLQRAKDIGVPLLYFDDLEELDSAQSHKS